MRGEPPGPEGSILKLFGSELATRIADFSSDLLGPYAMVESPTEAVPDASRWFHRGIGARRYTIAGGTSEIQRNIIGERVLGLPRGEEPPVPDPKQYRLGLNQPDHSPTARRAIEMAEAINRETGGEFQLNVFPESRLRPRPPDVCRSACRVAEFFMAGATLGGVAPTSALPLLPFALSQSKVVFAALDGALATRIRSELATKRTLCLSPLLAKRLSPSDDQREADPYGPTI